MRIKVDDIGQKRQTVIGDLEIEDYSIVHHSSGKPFIRYLLKDLIGVLANDMKNNISEDYDNIVVVEGGEGSGKSSWTWQSCYRMNPDFDFSKQLTYTIEDLKDCLNSGDDRHSVFWLDEAYDIANKRDWNTEKNKLFISLLVKMRSRGWTLYMDVPRFNDMDVYIRDHRARYKITCAPCEFEHSPYRERGYFEAAKRDKSGVWRHIGYGRYDAIPPEEKAKYDKVKEESQDKSIKALTDDSNSPGAKYRKKYEDQSRRLNKAVWLLKESGVSREDIMETLGISQKTYYNMIEKGKKNDVIGEVEEDSP